MFKTLLGGIAVGIANIIPGVSGGTMMVVLGIFNPLMEAINDFLSFHSKNRKKDLVFIMQVFIGAVIGLIGFAKVIEFLFANYPTQTMYWFIGMIVLSIPVLLKKEMRTEKLSWLYFGIGVSIIALMLYFAPPKGDIIITNFEPVELLRLFKMIFVGIVAGAAMLLPGISGSMMMLIMGEYYYFKSYVANVLTFNLNILIPLCFLGVGIILGIVISAKVTSYCLNKYRAKTLSFILGLIVASSVVLIPLVNYTIPLIISCFLAFAFGGLIVYGLEKI